MIQTARDHWKILTLMFIVVLLGTNANALVYFVTSRSVDLPVTAAQTTQPTVRFDVSASKFSIGDIVTVAVLLSSPTQSVNAVSGEITFPTDKLKLISISTKDSISKLWIPSEPYFSTTSNSVVFAAAIPNPGFAAVDGNILTLTFQALAPGNTHLDINNLIVLANDGAGSTLDTTSQSIDLILRENPVTDGKTYTFGDINHNGKTDLSDLSILVANWGKPKNPDSDLDGNGAVDMKDLSILLSKIPR